MLSDEEIQSALEQHNSVDPKQAHFISRLANGNYSRALELLGEDVNKYRLDAVQFLRSILVHPQ